MKSAVGLAPCFLVAAILSFAGQGKVLPVDEAAQDPSFLAFRQGLVAAARKHDLQYILTILDPQIVNSFGGSEGIEGFKAIWEVDKPQTKLWDTLILVLTLGGSLNVSDQETSFWAPYVYSRWPNEVDAFEYGAIIGTNVRVRARPDPVAPVVATLSYDIVKFADQSWLPAGEAGENSWVKIITPAGHEGFVSSRFVRSPIDYRIGFLKKNGKWTITYFVAGD
ncbi:MAG: SH3 domain-containing protein [Terriglobia bacterium]